MQSPTHEITQSPILPPPPYPTYTIQPKREAEMARRLLQALSGVGGIYAGDHLLRTTSYQLSVWAKHDSPGEEDDRHEVGGIDGQIEIAGMPEAIVLASADALTLRLQDGRRLAFSITGTSGRILGRGGLQSSE